MFQLKPHQIRCIEAYKDLRRQGGLFRRCITSVTGSGKSVVMTEIARSEVARGGRVALYSIRRLLTDQFIKQLQRDGIPFGCRAAEFDEHVDDDAPVQICSMQTEQARVIKKRLKSKMEGDIGRRQFPLAKASLVIIDEAHLVGGDVSQQIVDEHYDLGASVLGFSATPFGCGRLFDEGGLIFGADVSEGRKSGLLVPAYIKGCPEMDTRQIEKIKTATGDWSEAEIRKHCWTQAIYGYVMESLIEHNPCLKPFFLFAPGVEESVGFEAHFRKNGIRTAHIDATDIVLDGVRYPSNRDVRQSILKEHESGDIKGICNRWVLREAVDAPWVENLILATPFGSLTTFLQICGRGLRASPSTGKKCIAEGSLVLTDSGLVPIEKVSSNHRLWDGCSWVNHSGVVCNGEKEVISYCGVTATPEHRVWTKEGWRTIVECARLRLPLAKTGMGGTPIRVGEGYIWPVEGAAQERKKEGVCQCGMRELQAGILDFMGQSAWEPDEGLQELQSAEEVPEMANQSRCWSQAEVPESKKFKLASLWRSRNFIQFQFSGKRLRVDRSESWASAWNGVGSNRQLWPLRAGKSSVVNAFSEYVAHQKEADISGFSQVQNGLPSCSICGLDTQEAFAEHDARGGSQEVGNAFLQTKRRVWDVLDSGPLHRFTVSDALVHNCLTINDHGGNFWRFGSPNADRHDLIAEFFDDPDGNRLAKETRLEDIRQEKEECPITCPKCGSVQILMKTGKCYSCEHDLRGKQQRFVIQRDGKLIELTGLPVKPRREVRTQDMVRAWTSAYWAAKRPGSKLHGYTFAQLRGMIASGNFRGFEKLRGQWPGVGLPFTPKSSTDWFRSVSDVPAMSLHGNS